MVTLPWPATDDALLTVAWSWVDVLAEEDYERVYREIGYAMAFDAGAEGIRRDIRKYRDSIYFPGETEFQVTDRRSAKSGNPRPTVLVRRYAPTESLPLLATVELDLPLNGKWSRLEADFVLFASANVRNEAILSLEDISSPQVEGQ